MTALDIIRRIVRLRDVDSSNIGDGRVLVARPDLSQPSGFVHEYEDQSGGGGGADDQTAAEVPFTPAGGIAATDVQAALVELDSEKAATSHVHAGEDITSGTVADARIAATIARDSEVTAAISASEAGQVRDGDAAGGVLSGTYPNPGFAADMATQAEFDAHVNDTADAHDASAISFAPAGGLAADDVQEALVELDTEKVATSTFNDHSARHENGGADEISVAGLSGELADAQPVTVRKNTGSDVGTRSRLNFIEGSNVTLTVADDAGSDEVDITIASSGGAGGDADKLTLDVAQTAHGLDVGDWVRLDGSGDYVVAQADTEDNAEVVGIVIAEADANNFTIQRNGYVEAGLSGLTAGAVYYLSPSAAGTITATEPTADGEVSKPVLIAESATTGWMSAEMRGVVLPVTTPATNLADLDDVTGGPAGTGEAPVWDGDSFELTDIATQAELDAHVNDATDAHDATAISVDSTNLSGTAVHVQGSLEELDNLLDDHSARHENGGADEISIAGLDGISTELANHLADAADAHDASAISIADAGNDFTATDVEGALAELQADHEADATALSDHIADTSAAHAASAVSVDSTNLSGTAADVQGSLEELDNLLDDHSARHENGGADEISLAGLSGTSEALQAHLDDAADAHDASAISIADAGNDFTATDVEGALAELQADHEADATALSDHIADTSAAHAASAVSVSSTTLSGTGTDVQAVFEEIDNLLDDHSARHEDGGADEISIQGLAGTPVELTNHLNDASDAHDASAISVADAGSFLDATEVEAALQEIAGRLAAGRVWLSAAGMWPSTTTGAGTNTKKEYTTNDQDLYNLPFDAATEEYAQGTIALPDWDGGTITATFYWSKDGTGTGDVIWGCQARAYGDGEAIDQAWGTAQTVTDAASATDDVVHISGATAAITASGTPAAGELVQIRVYRHADAGGDTFASDALLLGVLISYTRTI